MANTTSVVAPVSGKIEEVKVAEGQVVKTGDIIIVEHATKTESNVSAPASGRIKLFVEKGSQVNQGDRIAEIEG